ncbi:21437_t:CDS:1, partial [Gigaspora margarita]
AEFEQITENYSNSIEYNDMFNNNNEEFDANYISDNNILDEIIPIDCKSLKVKEIIDLNIFVEEQVDEPNNNNIIESKKPNYNNIIEPENKSDYDINEVVSAAMNNIE